MQEEPMEIDKPEDEQMEMDATFETEQMENEIKTIDLQMTSYNSIAMARQKIFCVVLLEAKIIKADDMSSVIEVVR